MVGDDVSHLDPRSETQLLPSTPTIEVFYDDIFYSEGSCSEIGMVAYWRKRFMQMQAPNIQCVVKTLLPVCCNKDYVLGRSQGRA
jgi:hypothetical protein